MPDNIAPMIASCVSPAVYKRYSKPINESNKKNSAKKNRKYEEKKKRFNELVLLHDIKEAFPELPGVEFTNASIADNFITVFYIPEEQIPDLSPVRDYLKVLYIGYGVRLVHVKDRNGKYIFRHSSA